MPRRPPKAWFERTVKRLAKDPKITDPKAVAGYIWHYGMKPTTKRKVMRRLEDPDKMPKPVDVRGYDHTVVRMVPEIDNLVEVQVRLPKRAFDDVAKTLEGSKDVEFDLEGGRIVRRGRDNPATNIFLDLE